jgi:hypothetical protein
MAGRKTIPKVMAAIEAFADEIVPDSYVASHPFVHLLDYEDLMLAFEGNQEQNFRNLTRQQRGLLIAQKYRIRRTDKGYEVPSQFNKGKYLVKIRYDKKPNNR